MARTDRALKKLYGRNGNVSLSEELELVGSQIAHLSERTVGEGQEKLNEEIIKLKGTFDDLMSRARENASSSFESATAKVREKPIESVVGAFAAGAIVAALIARR